MTEEKRIVIMISGRGTNMQAIVRACESEQVNADVVFVGSDNPDAKGLDWADEMSIPIFDVDYKQNVQGLGDPYLDGLVKDVHKKSIFLHEWFKGSIKKQEEYLCQKLIAEIQLLVIINRYNIDLLVLAGFMQIATSHLIDAINRSDDDPRIMNIHPALLPAFPGIDGYGDTIRYGCKVGGCTVHFVDYGEDTGPIIGQCAIPVLPDDDIDSFEKRGLQEEYKLFPECIQLFVQNKLHLETVKQSDGSIRKIIKIL